MSLSDVEIAQVVGELAPELVGAGVGKVHELPGPSLLLEIGRGKLLISAHPRASRLHGGGSIGKPGGPASAFAMLLRKRLGGLRVQQVSVADGERVVELGFGAGRDRLVCELTGPHANVFLVDGEGKLVSSIKPSRSTTRPLAPGDLYTLPAPAPPTARWRGVARFGSPPGVTDRVAAHYAALLEKEEEAALREQLGAALRRAIDRLERREAATQADLRKASEAEAFRKYGDLLLAHLWELPPRGASSVTLSDDFEEGAPLTIALQPTLDGKANAARYYKQHKRLAGGKLRIAQRLLATRDAAEKAREKLALLHGLDLAGLRRLAAELPPELRQVPKQRRHDENEDGERLPYREFRSLAGDIILVGRSAADNDRLTFHVARGNDVWLHTRDAPGAHVVVRGSKGPLSEATLLDAATLAAHHSPLSGEAQVDVSYTSVKNLRKPREAPPGLVYVSNAKTIRIRLEPERLTRLLAVAEV